MDLVAGHVDDGHAGERLDELAVAGNAGMDGFVAFFLLCLAGGSFTPGEHQAGGDAFQIPLEGAADGFVEIVDVEDESSVGCGEGAEVADVGVAADLVDDAGVGQEREVRGHDGHGATEESEGRGKHALVLERDE